MSKKKVSLFDDDEVEEQQSTEGLSINKNYADRYENWRRLEEMQKIKDKYGDEAEDSDDSESSEEAEWTEGDEEAFLKTLGALKSKDEAIYDSSKRYFDESKKETNGSDATKKKPKKEEKMTLKDYERKLVTERAGQIDESDDDNEDEPKPASYYEEQEEIRRKLREAVHGTVDEQEDLIVKRVKTDKEQKKEEDDFYEWMKSQEGSNNGKVKELVELKKAWNSDKLDEDEKFLRDYLLNKDYEPSHNEELPTYEEIVALKDDEKELDKQRNYEIKYNFRYEEPDQDFIKQFPRTVAESLRTETSHRKEKRNERLERKNQEKEEKKKELKQLKQMKKTEIEQKLRKLQKAAGCDIPLSIDELNADFDPKEFDRKMQEVFNDEYYGNEEALPEDDNEKPVFSDLEDSDYEDYDKVDVKDLKKEVRDEEDDDDEGEDVIGDGTASSAKAKSSVEAAKEAMDRDKRESGRKRKRNALRDALKREKPLFNPKEKTFEEYFDEYYSLDYEDIIGDQVTKFKYRKVEPNNFGLTSQEILNADERQLNAWVSLKKVTAYRTDQEERFDKVAYERKGQDVEKKKRLFATQIEGKKTLKKKKLEEEEEANGEVAEEVEIEGSTAEKAGKKKKRGKKKAKVPATTPMTTEVKVNEEVEEKEPKKIVETLKPAAEVKENGEKKARRRNKKNFNSSASKKDRALVEKLGKGVTDSRLKAYGLNPNRLKKSLAYAPK